MDNKRVVVIGGGTFSPVKSHLDLAAKAFGNTARQIARYAEDTFPTMDINLVTTMMAGNQNYVVEENNNGYMATFPYEGKNIITNDDLSAFVDEIIEDTRTKIVIFNAAVCDWDGEAGTILDAPANSDFPFPGSALFARNTERRLSTKDGVTPYIRLIQNPKIVQKIRARRKDIFLVAFKQTDGATEDEQYIAGLNLFKSASCNLVVANDKQSRLNMVITPEEARYHVTTDREAALRGMLEMAKLRSHLMFTRSTVVSGEPTPWDSPEVPESLRTVVDYCIKQNAYKPFRGSTVGHFACKVNDTTFLTSQRKTNFNDLAKIGLVKIETDGPDTVLAYGSKPSVGGQSQRILFSDHKGYDCVVHFHCPIKPGSEVPQASQYEFECGSHECGKNTSDNMKQFGNLKAVYLTEHGPNIIFNRDIDPQEVIDFIEANFDLSKKTGGYVSV